MDGLHDRKSKPGAVWNKLSQGERDAIIELPLAKPELSPEELAVSSRPVCLRIQRLQVSQGAGLDYQPCLYPDAGFGQVPTAHPSY